MIINLILPLTKSFSSISGFFSAVFVTLESTKSECLPFYYISNIFFIERIKRCKQINETYRFKEISKSLL